MTVSAAVLACTLLMRDTNLTRYPTEERLLIADAEAAAMLANVQPHVPLSILWGVAFSETRFDPNGSQSDRDSGWFGMYQISAPELRCWGRPEMYEWMDRRHRHHMRFVRHDDASACTPEQTAQRMRLLDPTTNTGIGARLLERRYRQISSQPHDRSVYRDWVGAFYWGSAPPPHGHRRTWIRVRRYAAAVHRAEAILRHRIEQCESSVSSASPALLPTSSSTP
jgi:hypothetical protein